MSGATHTCFIRECVSLLQSTQSARVTQVSSLEAIRVRQGHSGFGPEGTCSFNGLGSCGPSLTHPSGDHIFSPILTLQKKKMPFSKRSDDATPRPGLRANCVLLFDYLHSSSHSFMGERDQICNNLFCTNWLMCQ